MKSVVWPEGYGRRVLPEVDSTMAEAARLTPGLAAPTWVLGLRQTAGRGRRGRAWSDPEGNFAATLVLFPEGPPEQAALRSFVTSLALLDACVAATGRPEAFALKWPNDVLLNGGKLAGILLERSGVPGARVPLLIGIGVNLVAAPGAEAVEPGAFRPVSLMSETGAAVGAEAFLDLLAPAYARREAQFAGEGFEPIRRDWLDHAARLGEEITARTGKVEITGRFETVDAAGNLVLLTPDARQAIPAAEVFF
ncbi:MAG: biotin--[acetyl-CoA-carboxylase] ligase [Roseovarius sp.]